MRFPLLHSASSLHLAAVRFSIPIALLLVFATVGGVWWSQTRHMDFLTPPSQAKLEEIRAKSEASIRWTDKVEFPVPVKVTPLPPVEPPQPKIDLGDLATALTLQNYAERTPQGSAQMIKLATALEEKGEYQRAWLAWERVLDLTKPDASQAAATISAVQHLRQTQPPWNSKPEAAVQLTLNISTGKKLAKALTPILETLAMDLNQASSGIVKIKPKLVPGKNNTSVKGPIAISLSGPDPKSTTTEVLAFTIDSPATLRNDVLKTIYQLIANHLARATAYTPLTDLADGQSPLDALHFRVTRLCWSEFAAALNTPAPAVPKNR
jgi:hypothetical protein